MVYAQSHGYVFFGPGGVTSHGNTSGAMYLGGGGEAVFGPGIGVGAEVGYTAPWRQFQSGIGIGSVNGSFHFGRSGRVVPFITGGYTLFFRSGTANGFNFGGGVNWWFADRIGLKTEIRDQVGLGGLDGVHFWAARVGLTFR
jgi:hypothetical protein